MKIKFLKNEQDGLFYFQLLSDNNKILLESDGYESEAEREGDAEWTKDNFDNEDYYLVQEIGEDWLLTVQDENQNTIASSNVFKSRNALKNDFAFIDNVKTAEGTPYQGKDGEDNYKPLRFYQDKISGKQTGIDSFSHEGKYYFTYNLYGKVILISESYPSEASRDNGAESVLNNVKIIERYQNRIHPNGRYYFNLLAGNNQEIATSIWFDNADSLKTSIELLSGKAGGTITIVEEIDTKLVAANRVANIDIEAAPIVNEEPKEKKKRKRKKRTTPKVKKEKVYLSDGNYLFNDITYQVFRSANDKHYFTFKNRDGKTLILNSDVRGFESQEQAEAKVQEVLEFGPFENNFEGKTTKNGKFYFYLKNGDGKNIAKSFFYESTESMQEAVGLFLGTQVADQTAIAEANKLKAQEEAAALAALAAAQQAKKAEEEARLKAEEEARLKAEQEARLKAEEEARLKAEEEARLKAEEEARLKAEQEARLKAEEEARLKAEEEARLKAEEEARLKAEEEARLKAEEEARLKAEEEARLKAEEEARLKAEEEARLKAEEEARLKAEEEAKLKAEEEARLKAEEEARLKAEEEARLKAEEEARLKAEEEARLKAEEEAAILKVEADKRKAAAAAALAAQKDAAKEREVIAEKTAAGAATTDAGLGAFPGCLKWLLPLLLLLLLLFFLLRGCGGCNAITGVADKTGGAVIGAAEKTEEVIQKAAEKSKEVVTEAKDKIVEPAKAATADKEKAEAAAKAKADADAKAAAAKAKEDARLKAEADAKKKAAEEEARKKAAAVTSASCSKCASKGYDFFKFKGTPKSVIKLGSIPEYGNSHALSPSQFYNKLKRKYESSNFEKGYLNMIFKAMGYSGFREATPDMFSNVTLQKGTKGNLGFGEYHGYAYYSLDTEGKDLKAFKIQSKNGCDIHFMKTCGNFFFYCSK